MKSFLRSSPAHSGVCSAHSAWPHTKPRKLLTSFIGLSVSFSLFFSGNLPLNSFALSSPCHPPSPTHSTSAFLLHRQRNFVGSTARTSPFALKFSQRNFLKMSGSISPTDSAETPTFSPSQEEQSVISRVLAK